MRKFLFAVLTLVLAIVTDQSVKGQAGVLNPNDAFAAFPAGAPVYGKILKWSNTAGSNTYGYKSYYFNGMAFRLKFPKTYTGVADGKKYPVFVFLHGAGELGSIYDNNKQLYWGGDVHAAAVDNGTFDGFLLYPQSNSGWLQPYGGVIFSLLDSMTKYVKADLDRVTISGLSAGGQATWDFMQATYAQKITAAIPLSAAKADDIKYFPEAITIPVWISNGGKDNDPSPALATQVIDTFRNLGGNIKQSFFPASGHNTWQAMWADPDYFPFLNSQHKANPLVYFQQTEVCPGDINVLLALQPGFYAYEWKKDDVVIDGAISNQLQVTALGKYEARFKRSADTDWSIWSPTPVVISPKSGTITPSVKINGAFSNVLPSPDGNNNVVPLIVSGNYASYEWYNVDGGDAIISTSNKYNAAIGQYKVRVTDQSGCSSGFSDIYKVIAANGTNLPEKVVNVTAFAMSQTSIELDWNDNPNPAYNETGFEIYRSTTPGANYQLITVTNADALTYTDLGLLPGTKYYYIIRAINGSGASALSSEVNATTQADAILPTAPAKLIITATTTTSVSLAWDAASDDLGVYKYDIYINGVKAFATSNTEFTVVNLLVSTQLYAFTVKARDLAGNISPASNQVVSGPIVTASIPARPAFLNVTSASYNKINLSWTDNSANETGFEITRSTQRLGVYAPIGTTAANATSFIDSVGLAANTQYWYNVRAVNANGASGFISTFEAGWSFNNDLTDASGNGRTLTGTGSPTYSVDLKEGAASLSLNGTTQYVDLANNATFPNNSFTTKTISVWIKPTAAAISGANKIIYDLGSSANGIGLRFNSGSLIAGIASGSVLSSITVASIATNANWVSNGWNHVVVVYNVNSLQLFVNGVSKGTASLSFSSVAASTTGFRIGATNSTNAFNSAATSTNYGGLIDYVEIISEPLNATGIAALATKTYTAATTSALPPVPGAPTALATQILNSTTSLSFNDNSNNETGFEVYRSVTDTAHFKLLTTLNANGTAAVTYIDSTVFANSIYYYKVRAIGVGGNSAYTSNVQASTVIITVNHKPVITDIDGFTMRYGTQRTIAINATDPDADPITFTSINVPAFGILVNGANGVASLQLEPSIADIGVYTISIIANDNHSAADTTTFTIKVNANFLPVANAVAPQSLNETDSLTVALSATDQDGTDGLVWSIKTAPAFATIGSTVGGTANIKFKPDYAGAGVYPITVTVTDASGDTASTTFILTVANVTPPSEKIFMDMRYTTPSAPAPWNNITGISTSNLLNSNGQPTSVGLQFQGTPWNTGNASNSTGNNSGIYPDAAIADYLWFGIYGAPETVSFNLTGLSSTSKYNLTLFSSSTWQGAGPNGSTVFTLNGLSKPLNANYNTQNTVTFTNVNANVSGVISVTMTKGPNTPYGMVNTIVLEKQFDDQSVPALPTNLAASVLPNGSVQLSWKDAAYNEDKYLVYRATNIAGPYTLLNAGASNANDTTYADATAASNTTYYYKVEATNSYGSSGLTAAVNATISVVIPPSEKIYMDMRYTTPSASAPWNNITGLTTNNLINDKGQASSVGLQFIGTPWNTGNASNSTGNNSGVYPDAAIADYLWFGIYGAPDSVSFRLTGLNLTSKYNVTLLSGSNWHGAGTNGSVIYTLNGVAKTLNTESNVKNTVTFSKIVPDASGNITVKLNKAANTPYGMLNTIVIEKQVDDSTAPVLPTNLAAQVLASGFVKLSWKDVAYNEDNYLVYRATALAGPYTLLNTGATNANDTTYTDITTAPSTTYYYKIAANNAYGTSGQTAAVSAVIGNITPATEKVYMGMRYTTPSAPAPWNNIAGVTSTGLLNDNGIATTVGLQFLSTPWNAGNASNSTGNNSGVYPDAAIADYFWFGAFGAPDSVSFRVTGLNLASKYNLTLFSSSKWQGAGPNGTVVFTLNGVAKSLYAESNVSNTVSFNNIAPDASGYITVKMKKGASTPYAMINTIVLEKQASSATVPAMPTNLAAALLSNGTVQLSWKDVAVNEDRYLVSRATAVAGPYTVLNAGATNAGDTTYIDATALGNTTYYYKVEATNVSGTSGQTPAVSITTVNKIPTLPVISDIALKGGATVVLNIVASDDPSNTLVTTVTGLPSFAVYQSTGNGIGKITFTPTVNDLGIYKNIVVKAADNFGASVIDTFGVNVYDSTFRTVYINFGPQDGIPQAKPWNNYLSYPFVNAPLSNLLDDANVNTGFSIKLNDQWENNFNIGMVTGDNSGVVPDNVMKGSIETSDALPHVIEISGLNPAKKYDIGFVSSFDGGVDATATYAAAGVSTVTFNGMYNSSAMVYLNGLTPNASGIIQVTLTKAASAAYLNLNAMEIHEYTTSTTPVRPYNLIAESILSSTQVKLTWSDRSTNETGFQVYRATTVNGTYTLVTTTAANVTTYTNTALTANTRYFYKVRAINGASIFSNYSNIASEILSSKIVFINLNANAAQNAPAPWNNTNGPSTQGLAFPNLVDNAAANSGIEMVITKDLNGAGFAGSTSASGLFPANVMTSNYWTDASQVSQVKFDNLDVRKKYRIGIFGSAINFGYFLANYTCNGKTVQLNSYNNSTKIVYLDALVPNADGELYIDISPENGYPYCFTGAFTIEWYDDAANYVAPILNRPTAAPIASVEVEANVKVYPNPFSDHLNVELNDTEAGKVALALYDMGGRLVYGQAVQKASGKQTYNINIPNAAHLPTGNYIFNVNIDGKLTKSLVLMKVN